MTDRMSAYLMQLGNGLKEGNLITVNIMSLNRILELAAVPTFSEYYFWIKEQALYVKYTVKYKIYNIINDFIAATELLRFCLHKDNFKELST